MKTVYLHGQRVKNCRHQPVNQLCICNWYVFYNVYDQICWFCWISDHNNVDCVILKDSKQKWQVKISKLFIWSCRSIDWLRNQTISHSAMQSLHIINEISQKKLHSGHIDISGGDLQTALSPRQRTPRQLEVDRWGHCDIWLDLKTHFWKVLNNLFPEFSL